MDIKVIYEDKNFIVINKPAGLLVHQAQFRRRTSNTEPSLVDWLLKNYPEVKIVGDNPAERPGIVHRLDKDTSGVMVIARNQETFDYLKSLFQKHLVKKVYLALVCGKLIQRQGVIDKPIGIKNGSTKRSVHSQKMRKEAVTEYRVVKFLKLKDKEYSLLEIMPKTGRTHQIRVHLASIGYPIAGDKLYGGHKNPLQGLARQFLHAESIEFTDSGGRRIKFEADLPFELSFLIK
ncbi:MAG: hypothetical protein A3I89_00515 [Candidatus Harrisonbacteria bacterium RIFCSPLOWO2_02_FULL_41_11]|uniref:Pseudouridine synthase n=1 Tax=Candidatus Harrisonbacteria bacterium RIFCSPHIGHO2_02_FULL_42_16 TaxID=1798404 RepID=A0A1G1ZHM1_9BACT|nr:MAG: hypothetical protein A3B92_02320 [Candidatus Harrisonbacteria bacterium RIFCSPHIGHO2_02_FULL_42_16]OGY66481.1 MAG: hypothetical protein A3I89_00515 [Candidatus Harrisonbacteria bacterium RIFCSPLOWO2_02_FULL_41_11]